MTKSRAMVFESPKAHARIEEIYEILSVGPTRVSTLATRMGLSPKAVYLYLEFLQGQIHEAGVDRSNGGPAKLYAWGPRPGVPGPVPVVPVPTPVTRCPPQRKTPPSIPPDRLAHLRARNHFKPQPVRRCAMQQMLFGAAGAAR